MRFWRGADERGTGGRGGGRGGERREGGGGEMRNGRELRNRKFKTSSVAVQCELKVVTSASPATVSPVDRCGHNQSWAKPQALSIVKGDGNLLDLIF